MRKLLLGFTCTVFSLGACGGSSGQSESADLGFSFTCQDRANSMLEDRFIAFLARQGFDSVNLAALQRKRGIYIFDLHITAMDHRHRIINILAFHPRPGQQVVALYSEPPTNHDAQLEESLLNFTSSDIGCTNSRITRGDNYSSVRDLHADEVRRVEGLLKEAKELGEGGA